MLLHHGTDYENAVKICNEKRTGCEGLLGYGKHLVCVHIPEESFGVEAYPLRTGKLTSIFDWRSEPMELLITPYMDIECNFVEM